MDYRASLGLDPVPLSKSLTLTAGRHVVDIRENFWAEGREPPPGANLHSWSDATYYEDHRNPEAMWEAPSRLGTPYDSAGYEIFAAGYRTNAAALQGWKDSPGHDALITQTGVWASIDFAAIGIGLDRSDGAGRYDGRVYTAWFGAEPDPAGAPPIRGTKAADRIAATAFADKVSGGAGADRISGAAGNDRLYAGQGRDRLDGGARQRQAGGRRRTGHPHRRQGCRHLRLPHRRPGRRRHRHRPRPRQRPPRPLRHRRQRQPRRQPELRLRPPRRAELRRRRPHRPREGRARLRDRPTASVPRAVDAARPAAAARAALTPASDRGRFPAASIRVPHRPSHCQRERNSSTPGPDHPPQRDESRHPARRRSHCPTPGRAADFAGEGTAAPAARRGARTPCPCRSSAPASAGPAPGR